MADRLGRASLDLVRLAERGASWLPYGADQIGRNADGSTLVSANSGRQDYIATMREWGSRNMRRPGLRNPSLLAGL